MSNTKISEPTSSEPKRIIVCCDGTWQSATSGLDSTPSNVTRLSRSLARAGTDTNGKVWQQVVYYDPGVGTGTLGVIESQIQGNIGTGLDLNVISAYSFIALNYNDGDEIFCFGFSRGAYTARAVAGLITDIGICEPRSLQLFTEVYQLYQKNIDGTPFRQSQFYKEFTEGKVNVKATEALRQKNKGVTTYKAGLETVWDIEPHGEIFRADSTRRVKAVGVWDTVGALGVPDVLGIDLSKYRRKFGFHNVKLSWSKYTLFLI
jgi:uncharacterized protein (DUF2235 family)